MKKRSTGPLNVDEKRYSMSASVLESKLKKFHNVKVSKPSPPSRRNPPAVPADGQQRTRHRMAAKKRTKPCRERQARMRHKNILKLQLQFLQFKKKVSYTSLSTYN